MTKQRQKRYRLQAVPVSFQISQHGIFCLPIEAAEMTDQEEMQDIVVSLQDLLPSGSEIVVDQPGSWSIWLTHKPDIKTTALKNVLGKEISRYLPQGSEGADWRKTLTEMQMVLHSHAVNQAREQRGQVRIDSLWFWLPTRWWVLK